MSQSPEPVVLQLKQPLVIVEGVTALLDGLRMKTGKHVPLRLSGMKTKIGRIPASGRVSEVLLAN
jgi:hypothetical protein